jgi:hypothetical protein
MPPSRSRRRSTEDTRHQDGYGATRSPGSAEERCDNRGRRTSAAHTRVLVVAHRTAATPRLLDEVRARACRSPCSFTLLVPRPYWDPETEEAAAVLELALPLLDEAAGGHVEGTIGDSDPFAAVEQAFERGGSPRFQRASRTGFTATSPIASRRSACLSRS